MLQYILPALSLMCYFFNKTYGIENETIQCGNLKLRKFGTLIFVESENLCTLMFLFTTDVCLQGIKIMVFLDVLAICGRFYAKLI